MQDHPYRTVSRWWWIGCAGAISVLTTAIYCELRRVEKGNLFLFALPGEAPATFHELVDAADSARTYLLPALITALIVGTAFSFGAVHLQSRLRFGALPWWLTIAFLLACLADFTTTMRFFQTAGVDHELHPAIRLFGYAYGRTAGPALGKIMQIVGLLAVAVLFGRWGFYLITLATVLFTAAAIYNFLQT